MTNDEISDKVATGLRSLREVQWMARRQASAGEPDAVLRARFDTATWLLADALRKHDFDPLRPDKSANTVYPDQGGFQETPSVWADGTGDGFISDPQLLAEAGTDDETRLQWVTSVFHPLAHRYADGRMTYATSLFNSVTRYLRAAGYDLSATETLGRSVWVRDGMGDSCDGLRSDERAERDAAIKS